MLNAVGSGPDLAAARAAAYATAARATFRGAWHRGDIAAACSRQQAAGSLNRSWPATVEA